MHEAYSHEVSSAGFWPGGDGEGLFYSYAYPEPDGYLMYQFSLYSISNVRPVEGSSGTAAESEGGVSGVVWIAVAAAVVVVIGATVLMRRRREERD